MNVVKFSYRDLTYEDVKREAKSIARSHNWKMSQTYEWMSKTSGFKDWNTFCAYLKSKKE